MEALAQVTKQVITAAKLLAETSDNKADVLSALNSAEQAISTVSSDDVGKKLKDLDRQVAGLERKVEGDAGGDDGLIASRKTGGSDAQILKKVSTRLQDFEAQITAQLSNMQSDFDKKLSHVNRGQSTMKPLDATGAAAGLDTMAEDLDQLKYDVGELKDLLSNNKGEVNHVRRIVLACERDMEDFTAAMDAVTLIWMRCVPVLMQHIQSSQVARESRQP
jgi:DNA anti-recombination protein RmuC